MDGGQGFEDEASAIVADSGHKGTGALDEPVVLTHPPPRPKHKL